MEQGLAGRYTSGQPAWLVLFQDCRSSLIALKTRKKRYFFRVETFFSSVGVIGFSPSVRDSSLGMFVSDEPMQPSVGTVFKGC